MERQRVEVLARQIQAGFTEEQHVRRRLEGNRCLTPEVVQLLEDCAGKENVFTAGAELEKHAQDHSHHLPSPPEMVIYARTTDMISGIMRICNSHRVPVTPCGARTGLEGGSIPVGGGVSLDLSKMNRVLKLYKDELQVHVQAGIKKEALNEQLESEGLFFQVDPASNPSLGGMAATGSSGTLCCKYGTMKENVVSLTVVMADGSIVTTRRRTRKNSTGYDLTHLCMGQEGTLAVIAELIVKVTPRPAGESSLRVCFDTLQACSRAVVRLKQAQLSLSRVELLNTQSIISLNESQQKKKNSTPDAEAFQLEPVPTLFLQVHASSMEKAAQEMDSAKDIAEKEGGRSFVLATDQDEQEKLWDLRRGAYFACQSNRQHLVARGATDVRMLSTDVCVPLSDFPSLIEETEQDYAATAKETGIPFLCNIFGHAADGNFHCLVLFDHGNPKEVEVLEQLDRRMWARALAHGGVVSGEHGAGMGKVSALTQEWGSEAIGIMWRIKKCLDEHEILNPGKLLPSRKACWKACCK
mmetsp:Transcript_34663/g.79860  ORF Transcript_34663/g.79860 Transcript_34663/m.79860 type:complete len:526 (-) Transcript_34663:45-1622(-)